MRSPTFELLLRQYIEHKSPENLRLHAASALVGWTAVITVLARVPVSLFGVDLATIGVLASVAIWAWTTPLVAALVLGWSVVWSLTPSIPWPDRLGWLAIALPLAALALAELAGRFAHVYHHEHAEYLKTDRPLRAALEQLGATVEELTSGARHTLATSLDENDQPTEAARALVRLRYYRRFLDEHQLALDELP